jgi:hypothetical protein
VKQIVICSKSNYTHRMTLMFDASGGIYLGCDDEKTTSYVQGLFFYLVNVFGPGLGSELMTAIQNKPAPDFLRSLGRYQQSQLKTKPDTESNHRLFSVLA